MTQSNEAAERSAHVVRGSPNIAGTNPQDLPLCTGEPSRLIDPFAGPTYGPLQLRAVAERDAEIARLRAEVEQARGYLVRNLIAPHYPGVVPLPDMLGVCTQVDNIQAGLRMERDAARALLPLAWQAGAGHG